MFWDRSEFEAITYSIEEFVQKEIARRKAAKALDNRSVCRFYQKGQCHKGNECPYRHSRGEKSVVCKHWLRGLCKKDEQCEFLHEYDMSKMPECHFFTTYGECSNPECPFLHLDKVSRVKDCLWYNRGFCKHGPKCRNRHNRTEPCRDYMAGFCPEGPKCKFGHPRYELPLDESKGGRTTPAICTRCHAPGHKATQCNQPPASNNHQRSNRRLEDVTCYKCGAQGHYANNCPLPSQPGHHSRQSNSGASTPRR